MISAPSWMSKVDILHAHDDDDDGDDDNDDDETHFVPFG